MFLEDVSPFCGALSYIWTSGYISSGFQSQEWAALFTLGGDIKRWISKMRKNLKCHFSFSQTRQDRQYCPKRLYHFVAKVSFVSWQKRRLLCQFCQSRLYFEGKNFTFYNECSPELKVQQDLNLVYLWGSYRVALYVYANLTLIICQWRQRGQFELTTTGLNEPSKCYE